MILMLRFRFIHHFVLFIVNVFVLSCLITDNNKISQNRLNCVCMCVLGCSWWNPMLNVLDVEMRAQIQKNFASRLNFCMQCAIFEFCWPAPYPPNSWENHKQLNSNADFTTAPNDRVIPLGHGYESVLMYFFAMLKTMLKLIAPIRFSQIVGHKHRGG